MISFIWSVKEVLRDHYKRHEYGEVILPMVVLRRLDATLALPAKGTDQSRKSKVLERAQRLGKPYDKHNDALCAAADLEFYNTSRFNFTNLLSDEDAVLVNFTDYLNGYSENVREIIQAFDFYNHVERLGRAGILYSVLGRFASDEVDLSPAKVSNLDMGYIYEEIIRAVAELSNEEAGEHFTPREVIDLMVNLLVADEPELHKPGKVVTVYDPTCGTGGMLTTAEAKLKTLNDTIRVHLRGQEVQPESYAVCSSDMLIRNERTAQIRQGDTLANDRFPNERFDFVIANPPYGKDWKTVEKVVKEEHQNRGYAGRFGPGLPPTSDGQMLFLLHMLAKLKEPEKGGGRLAVVMNGSPLFSGDAGSGPSEIRRHLIENDLVEAIVALPTELFYNTGIATYIWVVTNRKAPERQGYVHLIDARELFSKMPKSLGNKRNYLTSDHISKMLHLHETFVEGPRSKVLANDALGYTQVTVERPLKVVYRLDDTALAALVADKTLCKLDPAVQGAIAAAAQEHAGWESRSPDEADALVGKLLGAAGRVGAPVKKAVLAALTAKDPNGEPVLDRSGQKVPDSQLRDVENVPLDEDVDDYLKREVEPYAPDAWADRMKDRVGYEIPFTKLFYKYHPPRPLAEIDADIKASQQRILALIAEVAE